MCGRRERKGIGKKEGKFEIGEEIDEEGEGEESERRMREIKGRMRKGMRKREWK